jgi:hypothetical protein
MLSTFLLTLLVLGVVVTAMAVGVIFGREPIKGSCGGMGAIGMKGACDICGGDLSRCERTTASAGDGESADDLAYDATQGKEGRRA